MKDYEKWQDSWPLWFNRGPQVPHQKMERRPGWTMLQAKFSRKHLRLRTYWNREPRAGKCGKCYLTPGVMKPTPSQNNWDYSTNTFSCLGQNQRTIPVPPDWCDLAPRSGTTSHSPHPSFYSREGVSFPSPTFFPQYLFPSHPQTYICLQSPHLCNKHLEISKLK